MSIGKLLTPKNKRNTKTKFKKKMILNKRISVEHTINRYKQFKKKIIDMSKKWKL